MKPATNTATQKMVMIGKATKRDVFSAIVFHCQAKNSVDQFRTLPSKQFQVSVSESHVIDYFVIRAFAATSTECACADLQQPSSLLPREFMVENGEISSKREQLFI